MNPENSAGIHKYGHVFFWALFVVAWFVTLGDRALIHPDEGRYAELSLGMLQSGDWITPRLNGILYFEKPALQYWMGAVSFFVFGINEFAARLWPALTGLLSIVVVGVTARRLWGNGHYAALVMAGSFWVIANSHILTLDTGLMFFLTLALCAFLWAQNDDASDYERRYGMWVAWGAMAGATLSKGLVGLLIPGSTLFLYALINQQWSLWRRMQWLPGVALFLLLAGPWFWLVSARNPGFANFFFIREHFARYLTPEAGRPGPFWYFAPIVLVGFLPWTSLLPRLLREGWRHEANAAFRPERFALIWAVFVFVFFSASHSKLPSYILPMFPALALVLGQTLVHAQAAGLKKHLWLPIAIWALVCCLYPFAYLGATADTPLAVMQHLALYFAAGGALFLVCAALAWRSLSRSKILPAIMLLTTGSLCAVSLGTIGYDPFGQLRSSKGLVKAVRPYVRPGMEIFSVRTYDQTLPFYLQRTVTQVDYRDEFEFGQTAEPGVAIPTVDEFIARWKSLPQAMAVMDGGVFDYLQQQGVEMKPVYQDARRRVVIKP